jgi:dephospho-CoA kinase
MHTRFKMQISGGICSGKTTLSQYILNKLPNTNQVSFSKPIVDVVEWWKTFHEYFLNISLNKSFTVQIKSKTPLYKLRILMEEIFNDYDTVLQAEKEIIEYFIENDKYASWTFKDQVHRKLLQEIGGLLRQIKSTSVIEHLVNRSEKLYQSRINVICDDVRYREEVVSLSANGFISIRLEVSKEVQIKRINETYKDFNFQRLLHSSEIDLIGYKNFDYIIDADQSLEEVKKEIDVIINNII